jgi:Kua-ubiquitin conjugating enzyme hybrid localisation domain.
MKFTVIISSIWLWTNTNAFTSVHTANRCPIGHMRHQNMSGYKHFKLQSASLVDLATEEDITDSKAGTEKDNLSPSKSYLDDGFVFGLEGSGLERPKGKVAQIVVEGDSLETKPHQVAIVTFTFLNHFLFLLGSIAQLNGINHGNVPLTILQTVVTIFSSWVLADLGSGILHWSVDNYGNGRTPIMGGIIAAFQGHHTAPWTITERGFCNNVWKLCIPFGIPTVALISILAGPSHPLISLFFTVFCSMEILSQEFHKWSHMTTSQLHPIVRILQKYDITIDRTPHAKHHLAPFEGNYCIISGICNKPLDESGFFRRLEKVVYDWNGVESNAWKLDPELRAKTLRGDFTL